jgi:hypothetical protein
MYFCKNRAACIANYDNIFQCGKWFLKHLGENRFCRVPSKSVDMSCSQGNSSKINYNKNVGQLHAYNMLS